MDIRQVLVVIRNVCEKFIPYRGLVCLEHTPDDAIINQLQHQFYFQVSTSNIEIVILSPFGNYSKHSQNLRELIKKIKMQSKNDIMLIVEDAFFEKKNLLDTVAEFTVYPFRIFTFAVPEHQSVPPHRILSETEVEELLRNEHITLKDLPEILVSDPPIVWLGGKAGQVVEIIRDSQTTITSIYYRRIR